MPRFSFTCIAVAILAALAAGASRAEQLVVSNYGIGANGMPFAIAMEKGLFKQEGADVDGILSSNGGGTTVRILLGGGLAYGEIDVAGTIAAIQQGADLKIVSDNVLTTGEFVWAVMPDSPIRTLADFRGRKLGFTNPRSSSQALDVLLLASGGMKPEDADLTKVGGYGEQVAALSSGAIDIATLVDPVWTKNASRFRAVAKSADALPPLCDTIGVATGKAVAEKGDFLRAVLRARRDAVRFLYGHPDEGADIIAKVYQMDPAVVHAAVARLTAIHDPRPYWGEGRFDIAGMDRMLAAQKSIGALSGAADWATSIDRGFLPDDQKADY